MASVNQKNKSNQIKFLLLGAENSGKSSFAYSYCNQCLCKAKKVKNTNYSSETVFNNVGINLTLSVYRQPIYNTNTQLVADYDAIFLFFNKRNINSFDYVAEIFNKKLRKLCSPTTKIYLISVNNYTKNELENQTIVTKEVNQHLDKIDQFVAENEKQNENQPGIYISEYIRIQFKSIKKINSFIKNALQEIQQYNPDQFKQKMPKQQMDKMLKNIEQNSWRDKSRKIEKILVFLFVITLFNYFLIKIKPDFYYQNDDKNDNYYKQNGQFYNQINQQDKDLRNDQDLSGF